MFPLKHLLPSSSTLFRRIYVRQFHQTSKYSRPIEEFFEPKENWGEDEIRTGRSWRVEELRLKNNADLHKLWYVLLKERNMLMTMEEAAKRETELFPNPERIDKVEESMENLQSVLRERNAAVLSLEHGISGEVPQRKVTTMLGFHQEKNAQEHVEPAHMHPQGKEYETPYLDDMQYEFQKLWKERLYWKRFYKQDDEKRRLKKHKYLHKW